MNLLKIICSTVDQGNINNGSTVLDNLLLISLINKWEYNVIIRNMLIK
jgi:hypothetical protein